jgi:Holliday junction resolvase RusA-like endonuclease
MTSLVRIASPHVPISVNKAYRNATSKDRVKGRIKTKDYQTWYNAFAWDVKAAMVRQKPILGPYEMYVTIDRMKRHPLADVENYSKVVSDALQTLGVIENDKMCELLQIQWGQAQGGVLIELRPWFKPL